jgi:repressor LexA
MKELSKLINHYIDLRNINTVELGSKSGVSYTYISKIRNNKIDVFPSEESISKICDALEMTTEDKEKAIYYTALHKTPQLIKDEIEKIKIKGVFPEIPEAEYDGFYRMNIYDEIIINPDGKTYSFPSPIGPMRIPILKQTNSNPPSFALRHKGKEMEPKLYEGYFLIIQEGVLPPEGKAGLYIIDGKAAIREYRKDSNGNTVLVCLNNMYPPTIGDHICIGNVFYFLADV